MTSGPFSIEKWTALFGNFNLFLQGLANTVLMTLLAVALSLVLGMVFGILSAAQNRVLRGISRVYVEVVQNTPLMIQIFFLFNGLPYAGVVLPVFTVGVLGVGIYHGAYIAEVIKTGILSTPSGQFEAGRSQGFTQVQIMLYIILPQAVRVILPPLTNQFVNLIKNTSVVAMIAGGDLMYQANSWAGYTLNYGPAYVTVGVLYFVLCYPLARFAQHLERKVKGSDGIPGKAAGKKAGEAKC